MIKSKLFAIFSISLLLIVIDISEASDSTENETVSEIIKYFNENPNSPYIYKEGQYVNSQIKADILQVAINVNVTCKIIHPEVPCANTTLTCVAFLRLTSSQNKSNILSASCRHIEDISLEQSNDVNSTPQAEEISQNFDLSHESVYSEHNPDFVAVKKSNAPCLGCPFDMGLDVEGIWTLIDTALKHVEREYSQKHALVKVLRLQQQIVSGVKYILLLEIAPTVCSKINKPELCPIDNTKEPVICEVVYLEKPWLSDAKNIIKNNCTISQEYNVEGKPKTVSSNERKKEVSDDLLLEIESQIIPTKPNTGNVDISSTQPQIQKKNNEIEESVIRPTESVLSGPSYGLVSEESPKLEEKHMFQSPVEVSTKFDTSTVERKIPNSPLDSSTSPILVNEKTNTLTENVDEYTVINVSRKRRHTKCKNDESSNESDVVSDESSSSESDDDSNNISKNFKRSGEKNRESHKSHNNENKSEERNRKKYDISSNKINDGNSQDSSSSSSSSSSISSSSSSSSSSDSSSSSMESKDKSKHKRNFKFSRKDDSSFSRSDGNSDEESRKKERYASDRSDESSRSNECDEEISKSNQKTDKRESGESTSSDNSIETKEENSSSEQDGKNSKKKRNHSTHESSSSSDDASSSDRNDSKSNKHRSIHKRTDSKNKCGNSPESNENKSDDSISNNNLNSHSVDDSNSERESNSDVMPKCVLKKEKKNKCIENSESSAHGDASSHSNTDSNSDQSNDDSDTNSKSDSKSVFEKIKHSEKSDATSNSNSNSDRETDQSNDESDSNSKKGSKGVSVNRSENSDSNSGSNSDSNSDSDGNKDESDRNSASDSDDEDNGRVKRSDTLDSKSNSNSTSDSNSDASDSNDEDNGRVKRSDTSDSKSNSNSTSDSNSDESKDESDSNSKRNSERIKRSNDSSKSDSNSDSDSDEDKESHSKESLGKSSKSSKSSESSQNDESNDSKRIIESTSPGPFNTETNNKGATNFIHNELTNEIDEQPSITVSRRKRSVSTLEHFSEDEKQEIKKLARVAGKKLGAKKSKIHIISVKKLKMDDVYYRMKLKFENKSCIIIMSIIDNSDIKMLKSKCKDMYSTQTKIIPSINSAYQEDNKYPLSGIVPLNKTNDIKQYIYNGLAFLDSQSPHPNKYKIKEIVESSTQFTSGDIFKITAKVILSECTKESKLSPEVCKEMENAKSKICHFIISESKDHMNVTCEDEPKIDTTRVKRDTSIQEDNLDNIDFVNQQLFGNFMETYSKKYQNKIEFYYRFKVFKDNLNTIRLLNKFEQGTATYGVTEFADLTREEFSKMQGLRWDLQSENNIHFPQAEIPNITLPTEFDWRKKNAVTEVKDQGSCGSCWAFSTTGNIEGQYAIKYNKLLEFSEQELVDCDNLDDGCNGGLMDNAYRAIEKLGGLETENDYPYDAEGEKCKFTKNKVKVQISGALNISHDETDMAKWLVQNGPISIAINANAMQFYVGGVSHPWKLLCNPKNLDHGVLIVGFGVHTYPRFNKTLPFWIVKNSWGPSWGEQGYYRVYRGDGTCGLNQTPSSAIVA